MRVRHDAPISTPVFLVGSRNGLPTQSLPMRLKAKKRSCGSGTRTVCPSPPVIVRLSAGLYATRTFPEG